MERIVEEDDDEEEVDQKVGPLKKTKREYPPDGIPVFRDENLNNLLLSPVSSQVSGGKDG